MASIKNIFGHLAGLVTPKQKPKNSSTSCATPSHSKHLESKETTPNARTAQSLNMLSARKTNPHQSSQTPSPLGVKGSKITKTVATPKSSINSAAKSSERSVTFQTETPTKSNRSSLLSTLLGFRFKTEDSPQPKSDHGFEGTTLAESEIAGDSNALYEGDTIAQDDNGNLLKMEDEHDFSDFTKYEYFLFHKLNARGFEPILPATWRWEFRFLPDDLFTTNPTKAYLRNTKGGDMGGIKALDRLIHIGDEVRVRISRNIEPEPVIHYALKAYFKWTMRDAQLIKRQHVPVLTITCARRNESVDSLVERATKSMHALGQRYRDMWRIDLGSASIPGVKYYRRELPTIFGLMIKYSVVGFITYDARYPGKQVRNMGTWDFSQEGQEAWHGFAVAEFMCCARNYLMRLDRAGVLGPEMEDSDDPDA